jgi:TAP-like protein
MNAARQRPISLYGQDWTYAGIAGTVTGNLAHIRWWADLAILLRDLHAAATDASATRSSVAGTPRRQEEYDNLSEAFYATNCVDSTVPRDPAIYSRLGVTEDQRVPYFGPIGVFDYMPCAFWPGRDDDRYTGPWNRRTSAGILVVNNRYDPATPLHGAQDATAELGWARLLVIEGAGHTGMYVPSACGERVKREYLFTGVLPAEGTTCAADDDPFPAATAAASGG